MYSIVFQLAGSLLLAWMTITRRKKEIIQACWLFVIEKGTVPSWAQRIFLETYLSLFGFCYIALGYTIQFLSIDETLGRWFFLHNPINKFINFNYYSAAILNLAFLIILGLVAAYKISSLKFIKLTASDFEHGGKGSLLIDNNN
jgi:hypothetical protein